jgi:hypothetical protein
MGRLIPLLFLIDVALVAAALISCLSAEETEIRTLPRPAWVLIIVFFPLVGAIAWFSAGRPHPAEADAVLGRLEAFRRFAKNAPAPGQSANRAHPRVTAPDDDPEFLRTLDLRQAQARRDREILRRWEADLRREEESGPRDQIRREKGHAETGAAEPEDDRPST